MVVLTELVTRFTLVVALTNRTADHAAAQLFQVIQRRIPHYLRKALTFDQGRELTRGPHIAARTGFGISFCYPTPRGRIRWWRTPTLRYGAGSQDAPCCRSTNPPSTGSFAC